MSHVHVHGHVDVHVALRDAALLVRVGGENEKAEVSASGQKGVWGTRAQEISCFDCNGTMHVCMCVRESCCRCFLEQTQPSHLARRACDAARRQRVHGIATEKPNKFGGSNTIP